MSFKKKRAATNAAAWEIEPAATNIAADYIVDMRPGAIDARLALLDGSCEDVRLAWGSIGRLIRSGDGWFAVPPECRDIFMFLADALIAIGEGADANETLGVQKSGRDHANLRESFDLLSRYIQLIEQGASEREAAKVLAVINIANKKKVGAGAESTAELLRVEEDKELLKEMDKVRKRIKAANNRWWNAKMKRAAIYGGPEAAREVYEQGHRKESPAKE